VNKQLIVILGLIIGLSSVVYGSLKTSSIINDKSILITKDNLELFYFNNIDKENPYNSGFETLSNEQLKQISVDFIKREVLVREAKRLGLDEIDPIISARLAQLGHQALTGSVLDINNVNIERVKKYYEINKSLYVEPEVISFSHIFFSNYDDAKQYLQRINSETDNLKRKNLIQNGGIVFPYQKNYSKKPFSLIMGHFGDEGSKSIFASKKKLNEWQGPIKSSLGYHIIKIISFLEKKQLKFEDVLDIVKRDYHENLVRVEADKIINNKIGEYKIIDEINY
tara:strand:- start:276 stop:1121 length:846 start_codon:yes stop_codon:yes gene_type:complete